MPQLKVLYTPCVISSWWIIIEIIVSKPITRHCVINVHMKHFLFCTMWISYCNTIIVFHAGVFLSARIVQWAKDTLHHTLESYDFWHWFKWFLMSSCFCTRWPGCLSRHEQLLWNYWTHVQIVLIWYGWNTRRHISDEPFQVGTSWQVCFCFDFLPHIYGSLL